MAEKSTQDAVLQETLANLKIQEDRAVRLEKTFDENDVKLSELEDLKAERLGAFGELFGVVRGTASEMGAQIKESISKSKLYMKNSGFRLQNMLTRDFYYKIDII